MRLNGDGTQSRGFTYVDDIARGTILGLKPVGYEIINLGGHEVITMNDLIHMEKLVGRKANVIYQDRHPADMMENSADVDKARVLLGWEPQVSLEKACPTWWTGTWLNAVGPARSSLHDRLDQPLAPGPRAWPGGEQFQLPVHQQRDQRAAEHRDRQPAGGARFWRAGDRHQLVSNVNRLLSFRMGDVVVKYMGEHLAEEKNRPPRRWSKPPR